MRAVTRRRGIDLGNLAADGIYSTVAPATVHCQPCVACPLSSSFYARTAAQPGFSARLPVNPLLKRSNMNLRRWFPLSVSVTFQSEISQPVAKGRFSCTAAALTSWLRAALLVGLSCSCPAGATAQRPESSAPPPPTPQLLRGEQFGDAPRLHAPPVASAGASLWSRLWNGWSSKRTETQ